MGRNRKARMQSKTGFDSRATEGWGIAIELSRLREKGLLSPALSSNPDRIGTGIGEGEVPDGFSEKGFDSTAAEGWGTLLPARTRALRRLVRLFPKRYRERMGTAQP